MSFGSRLRHKGRSVQFGEKRKIVLAISIARVNRKRWRLIQDEGCCDQNQVLRMQEENLQELSLDVTPTLPLDDQQESGSSHGVVVKLLKNAINAWPVRSATPLLTFTE